MLWTYVVKCKDCGREINRAEHVPEEKKTQVAISASLMCFCPERSHNTGSDFNLHFDGEWIAEGETVTDGAAE